MSQSLKYLRDLTERLLSFESPRPCIDLKKVSKGFKCSKEIIKNKINHAINSNDSKTDEEHIDG